MNKLFLIKYTVILLISTIALPAYSLGEYITATNWFGLMGYTKCRAMGDMRFPVIFVSYQDVDFNEDFENVKAHFDAKFNEEGFTYKGSPGSVRDYFIAASAGNFTPTFDLYGPVQLPYDREYYGKDNSYGVDENVEDMVIHAIDALGDDIDLSLYDADSDGYVDDVIIVFAGEQEYTSNDTNTILPTSYLISLDKYYEDHSMRYGYTVGNMMVDSYTVINEIAYGEYDGIGTFVHEFMHGMGLADVYSTTSQSSFTPQGYDVMDVGIYNNGRNTPPTTSAFERFALGWTELELIDEDCEIEIEPLLASNHAFAIRVSDNELFIFENRQNEGWDEYIPGHGMLVWHIDYDYDQWYNNTVNVNRNHQRIDLVEACGSTSSSTSKQKRYPFPGADNVTSLTSSTTPALVDWKGNSIGFSLINIEETTEGLIKATVTSESSVIDVCSDSSIITITDVSGRVTGSTHIEDLPTGIYLVKYASGQVKKVAIR